jgi:DNA-binding NarL/FixJ family response regulator
MEKINILIVDDHPMVLEGLKSLLSGISYLDIAGIATNAFEAMDIIRSKEVHIAIVDIILPDINGIELTKKIKTEYPGIRVLAMSTFKERSYISQMIQNGASGYLVKSATREEIEEAILTAHEGKLYLSLDINTIDVKKQLNKQIPAISSREKEVLCLIADGLTNQQIATQLFISSHTVESHRKNLLIKFEANNTATLIKMAVIHNIV